jgi:hypothetical protein
MENRLQDIFVPYEESLELKQLGFDEECLGYHNMVNHSGKFQLDTRIWENSDDYIETPTWEQAFKFFRDKYDSHHSIMRLPQGAIDAAKGKLKKYWFVSKDDLNPPIPKHCDGKSDTYEEARLECLKQLIKIVKDGK